MVTSTVPEPSDGDVAVTWVAEATVKLVAAARPKSRALVPMKLVPLTVTMVPPAIGPDPGLLAVMVGTSS